MVYFAMFIKNVAKTCFSYISFSSYFTIAPLVLYSIINMSFYFKGNIFCAIKFDNNSCINIYKYKYILQKTIMLNQLKVIHGIGKWDS